MEGRSPEEGVRHQRRESDGNLDFGSHDETRLRTALSGGAAQAPDTTAEDAAAAAAFGDQADIQDSFGDPGTGEPIAMLSLESALAERDPNGVPYQVRYLLDDNGGIAKRQIYIPKRPVQFNGELVTPTGNDNLKLGEWSDYSQTALYLEVTIDNSENQYSNGKEYRYQKPKVTAKWQTSHTETRITEDKIVESFALATDMPTVAGGSAGNSLKYNHVCSGSLVITDPFVYFNHITPMDVVSDIRFEDTGTEIKCHVTRSRVGVIKLDGEDASAKEDWKSKGDSFEAQSDSEIRRVLKMTEVDNDTEIAYSTGTHSMTKTVTKVRVIDGKGGSDPASMAALQPQRNREVFNATSHADEHRE